jgi:hypothetical protein
MILTRSDGCVFCCEPGCLLTPTPTPAYDSAGRRIFNSLTGQFIIVVEGRAGANGRAPGTSLLPSVVDNRPDVQVQSTRPFGNGDPQVPTMCPPGLFSLDGGIPAINPPSFAAGAMITNALNDFACRFDPNVGLSAPCTLLDATREPRLVDTNARVQFCTRPRADERLQPGESVLTLKLRDTGGSTGPTAQIVVRVATPTPRP